ncbi:MAG: hypothetical protein WC741_03675 [Patescibacteria group bacterium]|jgi:hypothetical protein
MTESTGGKIFRGIVTTAEVLGVGFLGYLGARSLIDQNANRQLMLIKQSATLNSPSLLTPPGVISDFGGAPSTPTPEAAGKTNRMAEWLAFWPGSPERMAAMCGGSSADWKRNPEWPDSRTINNPELKIEGYINREWRNTNTENWPTTPEAASDYFFPGQNIDPKFMQPAWIDPVTKQITGWHLSEDHWLVDGSPADVTLNLHTCEVGEGYTVAGTLDPKDDRNWVAFGGPKDDISGGIAIKLAKGQGMTMWIAGTDPNAVALRMELFTPGDTPHYMGPNGEQLGPDAINFTPVYNAPGFDILSSLFNRSFGAIEKILKQTFVKSPTEILKASLPLAAGSNPQTIRRPQDKGKSAMTFDQHPLKGIRNNYRYS